MACRGQALGRSAGAVPRSWPEQSSRLKGSTGLELPLDRLDLAIEHSRKLGTFDQAKVARRRQKKQINPHLIGDGDLNGLSYQIIIDVLFLNFLFPLLTYNFTQG